MRMQRKPKQKKQERRILFIVPFFCEWGGCSGNSPLIGGQNESTVHRGFRNTLIRMLPFRWGPFLRPFQEVNKIFHGEDWAHSGSGPAVPPADSPRLIWDPIPALSLLCPDDLFWVSGSSNSACCFLFSLCLVFFCTFPSWEYFIYRELDLVSHSCLFLGDAPATAHSQDQKRSQRGEEVSRSLSLFLSLSLSLSLFNSLFNLSSFLPSLWWVFFSSKNCGLSFNTGEIFMYTQTQYIALSSFFPHPSLWVPEIPPVVVSSQRLNETTSRLRMMCVR